MSHSDRDARGGHAVRYHDFYACGCCPVLEPKGKSRTRATREREADNFRASADGEGAEEDEPFLFEDHVYVAERCVRCNSNVYDVMLYGPEACPGKQNDEPISYTTETGHEPVTTLDLDALLERGIF